MSSEILAAHMFINQKNIFSFFPEILFPKGPCAADLTPEGYFSNRRLRVNQNKLRQIYFPEKRLISRHLFFYYEIKVTITKSEAEMIKFLAALVVVVTVVVSSVVVVVVIMVVVVSVVVVAKEVVNVVADDLIVVVM